MDPRSLTDRIDALEVFRDEVRKEFAETRRLIVEGDEETRRQMREGDEETRRQMRVLHEDLVDRIKVLGELSNSGSQRKPRRKQP